MVTGIGQPILNENTYNNGLSNSLPEQLDNMPTALSIPSSNEPNIVEMGSELTNLFEALGAHGGDYHRPLDETDQWMTKGFNDNLQSGNRTSRGSSEITVSSMNVTHSVMVVKAAIWSKWLVRQSSQ